MSNGNNPAFPFDEKNSDGTHYHSNCGMTLRDYFAAQAVAGGLARSSVPEYDLVAMFGKDRTAIRREEIIAADAYRVADAMLKERSK